MASFKGVRQRLQASAAEAQALGSHIIEQEEADEISTFEDGVQIDTLEEHYATLTENEKQDEPLIALSDGKIKIKEGVVKKASESIIEPSTRQEYIR